MQEYVQADGSVVIDGAGGFEAEKSSVRIIAGVADASGYLTAPATVNFRQGGCFKGLIDASRAIDASGNLDASGNFDINVGSLAVGQRGFVNLLTGATPPTVRWFGVNAWLAGAPTFTADKLTVVELFNDATRVVGKFDVQE